MPRNMVAKKKKSNTSMEVVSTKKGINVLKKPALMASAATQKGTCCLKKPARATEKDVCAPDGGDQAPTTPPRASKGSSKTPHWMTTWPDITRFMTAPPYVAPPGTRWVMDPERARWLLQGQVLPSAGHVGAECDDQRSKPTQRKHDAPPGITGPPPATPRGPARSASFDLVMIAGELPSS